MTGLLKNAYDAYKRGDHDEAIRIWQPMAEQGEADSQFNLGLSYYKGDGVPQYFVLAHMWFNLSAAQGLPEAKNARDDVAKLMTSEQIDKAQMMAAKWKQREAT